MRGDDGHVHYFVDPTTYWCDTAAQRIHVGLMEIDKYTRENIRPGGIGGETGDLREHRTAGGIRLYQDIQGRFK